MSTTTDSKTPETRYALTVAQFCELLNVGPYAIPELVESGHIVVTLPPQRPGYCPVLDDARITIRSRSLLSDVALLQPLRTRFPLAQLNSHVWRTSALGGILRVLGR